MARNCSIDISIEGGDKVNLIEQYDFHLLESPARVLAPIREYEVQSFPESAEPEIDRRTVKQPFKYQISLGYWGNEDVANGLIRDFFNSLFTADGDILTAREVELFNNYKNVKMKGFAERWDEKTYTIEGEKGLIVFDFVLYVNNPNTLGDIQ